METLKYVLGPICALLLCGSLVSSSYVAQVANECTLVLWGIDYQLIMAHRGQMYDNRPVYREVTESGEYGDKTLFYDGKWRLWGDKHLGGALEDKLYFNCFPQDRFLNLGVGLLYGATKDTLCRPIPYRFESETEKVQVQGPANYLECLQKVAAEHPEATAVEFGVGEGCWYTTGKAAATTNGKGTWTSCMRTELVKLPGIGQPAGGYRKAGVLGACHKVDNYIFHYSNPTLVGSTDTFEECAQRVAEEYPDAPIAQWSRKSHQCHSKQGTVDTSKDKNDFRYVSCQMKLCDPTPRKRYSHEYEHTSSHGTAVDFEDCRRIVLESDPDTIVAEYNSKTSACVSKKGAFVRGYESDADTQSVRLQEDNPVPRNICYPEWGLVYHSTRVEDIQQTYDFDECARLVAAEHPDAFAVQFNMQHSMCRIKTGGLIGTARDTTHISCNLKNSICPAEAFVYDYADTAKQGASSSFNECAKRVLEYDPNSLVAEYNSKTSECVSKKGEFLSTKVSDADTKSCRLQAGTLIPSNCTPEDGRIYHSSHVKDVGQTYDFNECARLVAAEHPEALAVQFKKDISMCQIKYNDLWNVEDNKSNFISCKLEAVCPPVSFVYEYAVTSTQGTASDFDACAKKALEADPDALIAEYNSKTSACQSKKGEFLSTKVSDADTKSCHLQAGTPIPNNCTPVDARIYHSSSVADVAQTYDFHECARLVAEEHPEALAVQFRKDKSMCQIKFGSLWELADKEPNYISCKLDRVCTPVDNRIYHSSAVKDVGKTSNFNECSVLVRDKHPEALAVQFKKDHSMCQVKYGDLWQVEDNTPNFMSCKLEAARRVLQSDSGVALHNTDSCEECARQVAGMHIEATGAQWGLAGGTSPGQCQATYGDAEGGDASNWTLCKLNFCTKLEGTALNTGDGSYLRLGTAGVSFEQCAVMVGQSYPTASAVQTLGGGKCEVKFEDTMTNGAGAFTSCKTELVRRRDLVKYDDREGVDIDMGNAESLDECAQKVRAADLTYNGASYDKVTKKCYAVPEMLSADSTSLELRSNWQSAMIPHIPRKDYTDPKNINLELFYVQELTLSYCGESTCYTYEDEAEARQGKQQTVKREMFPMFKELSEEYASLKMGYLEFADKGIYPLGQSGRDWCHRFLNSMTPFNDEYKLWVEDHWNRTWASQPSGVDYVENQLDAAITSVMKGDFSTEDFDAEGKLNLRVLFMLTDKGFHVAGDVAAAGKCVEGNCKDYVPSVDQCQCVEHEYPSVDQTVDAMAKAKVNVLIYLGDIGQSYVKDLYDSVNVKLNEEDPSLQAVTVAPTEQGIQYFSPALFRQGLDALRTAVGSQA